VGIQQVVPPVVALPSWLREGIILPYKARIASVFIVHGDINGLFPNQWQDTESQDALGDILERKPDYYLSLRKYLEKIGGSRNLVMFYNLASGLRFLTPEMEQSFRRVNGLEIQDADGALADAASREGLRIIRKLPQDPASCLPYMEKAFLATTRTLLVIQSAHFLAPTANGGGSLSVEERATIERLRGWSESEEVRDKEVMILLLTDQASKVSPELRVGNEGIKTVLIPKPTAEERQLFLETIITDGGVKLPEGWDINDFVVATQGMNLRQISDIFLESAKSGQEVTLEFVAQKKKEILNTEYGDVMEVIRPGRGLDDIGGHDHIKAYMRQVLEAIRTGETRLVPMGVTLMGPPGTGKTALGEALAFEAGFSFVKMRSIRSMWVGESETRMEKLVAGLRSLAPVVVLNDEADLNDADRNSQKGDSGVSERIMKVWMEFLSDPRIRGKVVVISCTNRPDRIDPALKRSGRSDERILVAMPAEEERKVIFQVMFKRHNIPTTIQDFTAHAEETDDFSGADLEKLVLSSWRFAFEKGLKSVDEACLTDAINDFIRSASQSEIDFMTAMSLLESSSRRLLPINVKEIVDGIVARKLINNPEELVIQLKARNIISAD